MHRNYLPKSVLRSNGRFIPIQTRTSSRYSWYVRESTNELAENSDPRANRRIEPFRVPRISSTSATDTGAIDRCAPPDRPARTNSRALRNQHSTNNFVRPSNRDCPFCIQSCGPGSKFAPRPTCIYSCEAGKELTTGTQSQGKTTSIYAPKTVSPPTTVRRTDSSFKSVESMHSGSPSSTTKSAKSPTAIRPLSDDSPVRRAAALV